MIVGALVLPRLASVELAAEIEGLKAQLTKVTQGHWPRSAARLRSPDATRPMGLRAAGAPLFSRDPRIQQIEQQASRQDAPETVSRGHHLGEGVAENQLLLSVENHFAMFSHFGS
jgi:hypothetical protein